MESRQRRREKLIVALIVLAIVAMFAFFLKDIMVPFLRLQMAHAGMPILGDRKYGDPERTALPSEEERKAYPLCLCACRLSFYHPVSGKKMEFSTEPAFSDRMDVL